MDLVNFPAKTAQHAPRVVWRRRFAEDFSGDSYDCVSAEDQGFAPTIAISVRGGKRLR
jgi:hypothetical protein